MEPPAWPFRVGLLAYSCDVATAVALRARPLDPGLLSTFSSILGTDKVVKCLV